VPASSLRRCPLSTARSAPRHRARSRATVEHRRARRQPRLDYRHWSAAVVKRIVVGAHYGLKDWLVQRVTAVIMIVYTLLWLAIALYHGGIDLALWQAMLANGALRVITLLFGVSVLWHAWVGMRDIWMDYIKPTAVRLTVEVLTVVVLIGYGGWLAQVLWSAK